MTTNLIQQHSLILTAISWTARVSRYQNVSILDFTRAKDDGGGGDWQLELQSNRHHQQTNTQLFTGRMSFLSPNQQSKNWRKKVSHSIKLLIPSSCGMSRPLKAPVYLARELPSLSSAMWCQYPKFLQVATKLSPVNSTSWRTCQWKFE